MPIDNGKLLEYFEKKKGLPDLVITPELIEKTNKILSEMADRHDKQRIENDRFTSECRCHTGGICYFHTVFS